MDADIPIWLSGEQIIMKGVDVKTTCGEVIVALVGKRSDGWTMVERWKGVERPLAHRARILKVWNQWANDKDQVKLAIKKQEEKKIKKGRTERHNIERLLKLILAQGETIQNRLQSLASSDDKQQASSSTEQQSSDSKDEQESTNELIKFYDKITKINKRIEKQEEILVNLHIQIKRHVEKDKTILQAKIKQLKLQNESNYKELENNLENLNKSDVYIKEKTEYLQSLYKELHQSGLETTHLTEIKDKMENNGKEKEVVSDNETNSDTGLSSLHSSSEEGNFIIESAL